MPIFEFVESKKSAENLLYNKWKQNLDVALKLNTSILNIGYEDQQKDLIIPVLNKLSISYQDTQEEKRKEKMSYKKIS